MNLASFNPPTVLILGANGRLGCAAAQAFAHAGWSVVAQVRRQPVALLPAAARVVNIDLADTDALIAACPQASVVVHAVNPIYTRWESEALPALSKGLDVAQGLRAHFMLPGNVYNFGESMPPVLRESTPAAPTTRKGEIRVEMEAQMAQRAIAGGFAASVIRAGDFFGTGSGSWFDLVVVKSLRSGKLIYPGPLDRPHAWAYLPDLARIFVQVAKQKTTRGFTNWHFAGHTLTGSELLQATTAAALAMGVFSGGALRQGGMPWPLIRAGGLLVPMWRELAAMSYLWQVPHMIDGSRLAALGHGADYTTPLQVALTDSLLSLGFGPPALSRPAL